ncbi:GGDEF domain-containing protein [Sulfurospirillum barnesii]|uniref:diguanylate cyclase n=1 Tax=Sulfurospirillum barnesii (strain ATCC 700032 / DSM 10660 / SES-3) TaxID=760154 RepID=I3XV04_SULBS|nr:GGDEF domain-containing protein [Sulfurospirillum barnesii]AFL67778.1 diguanylate cyclase (GGDEF) domain-containing protein [Sulfurospirillum barnesii SES-3]
MRQNSFYLFAPLVLIVSILLSIFFATIQLEKRIETKIFEISTSDIFSITHNNARTIENLLKGNASYPEALKKYHFLQKRVEEHLNVLVTPHVKYAYLLYRDERGIFRFLGDASFEEEKSFLDQKFDVEGPEWLEIYTTKEPLVIRHTLLQQLSISYLIPILNHGEVELILAIDFSINKIQEINHIIQTIQNGIFGIMGVIALVLIFVIIQTKRFSSIKKSAFTDKLTSVYNRNYLQKYESLINLNEYVIAALDIDYFKKINDTYGHAVGDKVLTQIGHTLLQTIRKDNDIVIRYGGEEFLILAKIDKNANHLIALNVIERIFNAIQKTAFSISEEASIQITISVGVNLFPHQAKDFQEAFKYADIALYHAKHSGRNCIKLYDETLKT